MQSLWESYAMSRSMTLKWSTILHNVTDFISLTRRLGSKLHIDDKVEKARQRVKRCKRKLNAKGMRTGDTSKAQADARLQPFLKKRT